MPDDLHLRAAAHRLGGRSPLHWLLTLVLGAVCVLVLSSLLYLALSPQTTVAASAPALFVQGGLTAKVGDLVDVPIAFDSAGNQIAALGFILEYDSACLALAADDRNSDGVPDAIVIDAPAQFRSSIQINPGGQQGRLTVILADYMPPLTALPDTAALVTIKFRVACPLAPGLTTYAYVRFTEEQGVSFGDPDGEGIPGVGRGGAVQIIGSIPTLTPTPTPTPTPAPGTPTATPTAILSPTPPPPVVVMLEVRAAPEQLSTVNRTAIFVADYVVLQSDRDVTLTLVVPPHTYYDAGGSTPGWQCGSEPINTPCRYTLYTAGKSGGSGRLFFAVGLNWPLPAAVNQIELTAAIEADGKPVGETQRIIVPLIRGETTPLPPALSFDLHTDTTELVAGDDREVNYTFTYANNSQAALQTVEFQLILPGMATVHPAAESSSAWTCRLKTEEQATCKLLVDVLEPGALGQAPFRLSLKAAALLKMNTLTLVVYTLQDGEMYGSDASVVLIRQSANPSPPNAHLFLPLLLAEGHGE